MYQYVGYAWLKDQFHLLVPELKTKHAKRELGCNLDETDIFGCKVVFTPKRRKVPETVIDHLFYALKNEPVQLCYLAELFSHGEFPVVELERHVKKAPTGKMQRLAWHYYEWLTHNRLDIENTSGNYIVTLDPNQYFTGAECNDRRTRVKNNHLGSAKFCPVVRRTAAILGAIEQQVESDIDELFERYDGLIIQRGSDYLYTKETKASNDIEREKVDQARIRRFVRVLREAGKTELNRQRLLKVQNDIVNPDYRDDNFRSKNIYIGETKQMFGIRDEKVHYIPPKHEYCGELVDALLDLHRRCSRAEVHPVIHAATVSFGFDYIHPCSDGNGRTHRYLIHDVLHARGYFKEGVTLPVSATILGDRDSYDRVLETISDPLMLISQYDLDEKGQITIGLDTISTHRYPDMTAHVEYLFDIIKASVNHDLKNELLFLARYDHVHKTLNEVLDMPAQHLQSLCTYLVEDHPDSPSGTISKKKKKRLFDRITDAEWEFVGKTWQDAVEHYPNGN